MQFLNQFMTLQVDILKRCGGDIDKMIGDAVNIASRLCTAAGAGELVVDATLADDDYDAVENIQVKGRQTSMPVRRWRS